MTSYCDKQAVRCVTAIVMPPIYDIQINTTVLQFWYKNTDVDVRVILLLRLISTAP